MSNVDQAHNDAERGVAEQVYAVELPPPPMTASEGPTRVNSSYDLKDTAVPALPDVPPPPLTSADEKVVVDEKKGEVAVVKKDTPAPGAKKPAPSKPKWKRASRWVRFNLWYNTYRYVATRTINNLSLLT